IELSVGSLVALLCVLFVDFISVQDMSWMLALPLILVLGAVIGAVHGWLITRLNLQPFIITGGIELSVGRIEARCPTIDQEAAEGEDE
ncbi:hypothetical protein ACC736_38215, partial [Rhizobium ruizarguesonis]